MIQNTELFKRLKELEIKKHSDGSTPITNNISTCIQVTTGILERISRYMPDYTGHNIEHCERILTDIFKILPKEPEKVELNIVELSILIYAVILHDIGMVFDENEEKDFENDPKYISLVSVYENVTEKDKREIMSEFIRRTHVERSCKYIDKFKREFDVYKIDFCIGGTDISEYVKAVIRSHGMDANALDNVDEYPVDSLIWDKRVNIRYISILLRLGDVLDFSKERTPYYLYKHVGLKNPISILEWKKHLSITGQEKKQNKVAFSADFTFATSSLVERQTRRYIGIIENEILHSMNLIAKMNNPNYKLYLSDRVAFNCTNSKNYEYCDLRINFDFHRIIDILIGAKIYDSAEIFIRELLQNSYDACFARLELEKKKGKNFTPEIKIKYDSLKQTLTVSDNGIGINEDDIEKFILKIGASYYISNDYKALKLEYKPVSQFGIGMLSCFMVSDSINIESLKYGSILGNNHKTINITMKINDEYIEKKSASKEDFGTEITLKIRDKFKKNLSFNKLCSLVKNNMAYQPIPIKIIADSYNNDKICTLNENQIIISEEITKIPDIEIININTENIEGYIILHTPQYQQIFNSMNKVCQQYFKILSNNSTISSFPSPSWLRFVVYNINIKNCFLELKIDRNSITENANYTKIKNEITTAILSHFNSLDDKNIKFLNDGSKGNVIDKDQKQLDFLSSQMRYSMTNIKLSSRDRVSFKELLESNKGKEIKIIILHDAMEQYCSAHPKYKDEISQNDYIIYQDYYLHYFLQLISPYSIASKLIISDVPGLIYAQHTLDFTKDICANNYNSSYNIHQDIKVFHNNCTDDIFCWASTHNYSNLSIFINPNHKLAKIIVSSNKYKLVSCTRFRGLMRYNIEMGAFSHDKISLFVECASSGG
ncbi:MAG: ATP-binding protein, partial [Endomicrobiaceae bacterium]|nr:ATP-binding protein [Endomicrobiaceae bacterium]